MGTNYDLQNCKTMLTVTTILFILLSVKTFIIIKIKDLAGDKWFLLQQGKHYEKLFIYYCKHPAF